MLPYAKALSHTPHRMHGLQQAADRSEAAAVDSMAVIDSDTRQTHFTDKNSSGDEIANVNFYAVRP